MWEPYGLSQEWLGFGSELVVIIQTYIRICIYIRSLANTALCRLGRYQKYVKGELFMPYKWPLISSVIIVLGLFGQAAIAFAAERPCRADIEKFCSDVKPGGGRMVECLRQHQSALSPECKAHGKEMRERVQETHEACEGDIAKYCGDVRPGEGHVVTCLRNHERDISADCRASMKPAR